MTSARRRLLVRFALPLVFLAGLLARCYGLSWDQGTHLHPDERFLTMVAESIRFPSKTTFVGSVDSFFDTASSPANPHNAGHRFYVYGTLPLFLDRALCALVSGQKGVTYDTLLPVQRGISAAADALTILLAGLLAVRLAPRSFARKVAFVAALLYAALPFAIQQAHFGTVDALGTFFVTLAVVLAFPATSAGSFTWLGCGAALGAAGACKPNLLLFGILIAFLRIGRTVESDSGSESGRDSGPNRNDPILLPLLRDGILSALAAFVVFRIAQPYAFRGPGFFGLHLDPAWLDNMAELRDILSNSFWYPPGIQWIDRIPILEPAKNLLIWATGPALGILIVVSSAALLLRALRRDPGARRFLPFLLFVLPLLFWQATRPVASVRHAHPLLPLLTAVAAAGLPVVFGRFARLVALLTAAGTLFSAFSLLSIYSRENTRITASRQIAALFPQGAHIAYEYWDDPLPLPLPGIDTSLFSSEALPVFEAESATKARRILDALDRAELLVLSSRRGVASLSRLPDVFPFTAEYYRLLFSGALGFEKAALFEHRPGISSICFDDRGAEETLSVYDHPVVTLFRKTASYSRGRAAELLARAPVVVDTPSDPRLAVANGVAPDETPQARAAGVSSPPPPPRSGRLGTLLSLGRWVLGLELLGVVGMLLLKRLHRLAPWPGFVTGALARTLGFSLAGIVWSWFGFLVPGFQKLAWPLAITCALLTLGTSRGRAAWKSLAGGSRALFLGLFLFFLVIRAGNPEIFWGEKPMDAAILSAAMRTPQLPIPEPWLIGAPLDYYAQGFLPVALLARAAGASAGLAFNLAAATFPAFLGVTAAALGFFLSGRRAGGFAALFLTLLSGTLAPLFNAGFRDDPFGFNGFWSASRVIPDAINEFPLFTALFADLHAHLLSWAPLGALLLLAVLRIRFRPESGTIEDRSGALLLGALAATLHLTNPWETPLAVVLLLVALPTFPAAGSPVRLRVASFLEPLLLAGGAALAAALPTLLYVRTPSVSAGLFAGPHTNLLAYLELFGLPLLLVASAWVLIGVPPSGGIRIALGLALGGALLLLFSEFFFVADRMNTLFKFGLQARILLGLAAGALVPQLLERARAFRPAALAVVVVGALLALVAGAAGGAHLIAVLRTRRVPGPRPALDGFAYVAGYDPEGERRMNELNGRLGLPAIFDPPGTPYSANLQTTMRTGCPTIVGWPWHLRQRRRSPFVIQMRERDAALLESSIPASNPQPLPVGLRSLLLQSYGIDPADRAALPSAGGSR